MADEQRCAAVSWLAPPVVQPMSRHKDMVAQWQSAVPPALGEKMVKNPLVSLSYHGKAELDCWQPSPTAQLMVRNTHGTVHGP